MLSLLISEVIGILATGAGLALLKYDPLNLFDDKGISFDFEGAPWRN